MAERQLTQKQLAFISVYIKTGNASEAYRQAYDCTGSSEIAINVSAHRVLKNPKVELRIKELQGRAAQEVVLTRAFVLEGLMNNAREAAALKDFTASNKAFELLGKTEELSMFVERANVTTDNRHTVEPESLPSFIQHLAGVAKAWSDEAEAEAPLPN